MRWRPAGVGDYVFASFQVPFLLQGGNGFMRDGSTPAHFLTIGLRSNQGGKSSLPPQLLQLATLFRPCYYWYTCLFYPRTQVLSRTSRLKLLRMRHFRRKCLCFAGDIGSRAWNHEENGFGQETAGSVEPVPQPAGRVVGTVSWRYACQFGPCARGSDCPSLLLGMWRPDLKKRTFPSSAAQPHAAITATARHPSRTPGSVVICSQEEG